MCARRCVCRDSTGSPTSRIALLSASCPCPYTRAAHGHPPRGVCPRALLILSIRQLHSLPMYFSLCLPFRSSSAFASFIPRRYPAARDVDRHEFTACVRALATAADRSVSVLSFIYFHRLLVRSQPTFVEFTFLLRIRLAACCDRANVRHRYPGPPQAAGCAEAGRGCVRG